MRLSSLLLSVSLFLGVNWGADTASLTASAEQQLSEVNAKIEEMQQGLEHLKALVNRRTIW